MTCFMGACPVAVLPCGTVISPKFGNTLNDASDWFRNISGGRWWPDFTVRDPVSVPRPLAWYRIAGGCGPPPQNSQSLAQHAVRQFSPFQRRQLAESDAALLLVADGFRPHCWHLPEGGIQLANRHWFRRYAVVPMNSPVGWIAHELGHLLFDWPDLGRASLLGERCLMAEGAVRADGDHPASPCSSLLFEAGWRQRVSVHRNMMVGQLSSDSIGFMPWGECMVLIERLPSPCVLRIIEHRVQHGCCRPRFLGDIPLTAGDASRTILGMAAPVLRRRVQLRHPKRA